MTSQLAVAGGEPLRTEPWPQWPVATSSAEKALSEALHSGRWTVSGPFTGVEPFERRFAHAFAQFNGVEHCVPTCHGSSALVVALRALGVGVGSEVLVPGITWVACASAVVAAGGVPILVDVDPATLCISVEAAEAAITDATAAIMIVHLFCTAADIDGFKRLGARTGIPILEDCSQAHGAIWRGARVGSLGAVGVFSFQQTKLLTCGEGGAAICSDERLYDRMQQHRADGRRFKSDLQVGLLDLEEVGSVQGHNYCLSEFHAALLLDGLQRLDEENALRRAKARRLETLLDDHVKPIGRPAGLDQESYYRLCLRVDRDAFNGAPIEWIAQATAAELRIDVDPVYDPLCAHTLYKPLLVAGLRADAKRALDPARFDLPTAVAARRCHLSLPNQVLLADDGGMDDVANAFHKVSLQAMKERHER